MWEFQHDVPKMRFTTLYQLKFKILQLDKRFLADIFHSPRF